MNRVAIVFLIGCMGLAGNLAVAGVMVNVGNAGNTADTATGYGAVSYDYQIGKFEVTAAEYTEFLNAVAKTDTYALYNSSMANAGLGGCRIQQSGSSGSFTYSVATEYANRPVNFVSFGDAARFSNWLHNGKPTGEQGSSTTETGAYSLNGKTTTLELKTVKRSADATYFIPTENEWYKAAYHDKNAGTAGTYYAYPTSTNAEPSSVLVDPDPGNNATFKPGASYTDGTHLRTEVGAHENSDSPYGTFDQGGNVWEWTEAAIITGSGGAVRGGAYNSALDRLSVSYRYYRDASYEDATIGFRVAGVATAGGDSAPAVPAKPSTHSASTRPD